MKIICLFVLVAFAAQSEASLKCFKIIKNNTNSDCITELETQGDPKLAPFTNVVTANADKLRTKDTWCTNQATFVSFIIPDAQPAARRRKRAITALSQCTDVFNYTINNLLTDEIFNSTYANYNAQLKTFVDALLAGEPDQEFVTIYTACFEAVVSINSGQLNDTTRALINSTCITLASFSSGAFNGPHCYECAIWGLDNQAAVKSYYGLTTPAP